MAGLNKMAIIGNLGRPVQTRSLPDGKTVANFSVAVTEKIKGESKTLWFRCVAFGQLGDICSRFLDKGSSVYIEGRLQTNEWTTKEGEKRFDLEIVAQNMVMLSGGKQDGASGGQSGRQAHDQAKANGYAQGSGDGPEDDPEIPF